MPPWSRQIMYRRQRAGERQQGVVETKKTGRSCPIERLSNSINKLLWWPKFSDSLLPHPRSDVTQNNASPHPRPCSNSWNL